ncbi:MBL fold metallo-hydrolase [Butyrivibrio sp. AE2032]|uniref:MBL fold metallo-hydrolase n=1 Tax=Butyrivibrio sp. AE2032 TaxID=1458463 RepID=UPI00163AC178|nr:MBL fold metallo-hydrolase [Butyrivibrio sp. AE2032]
MLKDKDDYETPEIGGKTTATDDRIHYIKLYDDEYTKNCDAIVIESNGHFGLVDAAWDKESAHGSESGEGVKQYLLDLGVKHLDFVIATHSHSDHIGGMPKIADYEDGYKIVDENTVYFYKPYVPNPVEDEMEGWNNGDYFTAAFDAMLAARAQMVNVDSGSSNVLENLNSYFKNSTNNIIRNFNLDASTSNKDQHRLSFDFGDFKMELFNLHYQSIYNENSNSIVTYLEKNGQGTILLGDIGVVNDAECRIGKVIKDLHNNIQVIKVGHHGSANSTSRRLLDLLEPKYLVITAASFDTKKYPNNCDAPFCIYMKEKKASVFYTKFMNGKAVVQVMEDKISFVDAKQDANGKMTFTDEAAPLSLDSGRNGWAKWVTDQDEKDENKVEIDWYFINSKGEFVYGWYKVKGKWYYLGEDGIMVTGWKKIDGKWYYFKEKDGDMVTGWKEIKDKWYYFNESGDMVTGWKEIKGKWYYFKEDGDMVTGWKAIKGKWYYFNENGDMVTGWKEIKGEWYYLKPDGSMAAREYCEGYWLNADGTWTYPHKGTWRKTNGQWWFGDDSGWYAKNETVRIDGKDYAFDKKGYLVE